MISNDKRTGAVADSTETIRTRDDRRGGSSGKESGSFVVTANRRLVVSDGRFVVVEKAGHPDRLRDPRPPRH